MEPLRILPCTCKHEGQDKMYGKGMRVMNWAIKQEGHRCTVCGQIKKKG